MRAIVTSGGRVVCRQAGNVGLAEKQTGWHTCCLWCEGERAESCLSDGHVHVFTVTITAAYSLYDLDPFVAGTLFITANYTM